MAWQVHARRRRGLSVPPFPFAQARRRVVAKAKEKVTGQEGDWRVLFREGPPQVVRGSRWRRAAGGYVFEDGGGVTGFFQRWQVQGVIRADAGWTEAQGDAP